jgi:uncharacterized repeat protein (TIGR01451 family)
MCGQNRPCNPKWASTMLIVLLLLAMWLVQPVAGVGPAEMPQARPTLPQPGSSGPNGSEGLGDQGLVTNCTSVRGLVVNWGYQNEPGVTLRLTGDSYELTQVSTSDGRYEFAGLGQGYAILQPLLTDSQRKTLAVHTDQVAVPLKCDLPAIANMGLYSGGKRPQPPASLTVMADKTTAAPGSSLRFQFKVRNGLPNDISNVIVTDLFPAPLQIVSAEAGRGEPEALGGRMFALPLGVIHSGEEVSATVTVQVDPSARSGEQVVNRTTLLYAESMADQVVSAITIGKGVVTHVEPVALLTTSPAVVAAAAVLSPALSLTTTVPAAILPIQTPAAPFVTDTLPMGTAIVRVSPISTGVTTTLTSGEQARAEPSKLPTTGLRLVGLPLLGLGLIVLAVLAQALRKRNG